MGRNAIGVLDKMSKEELLLKYWRELPLDHQQELIHFAEVLHTKTPTVKPRPNLKGLCSDLKIDLGLKYFKKARQEVWANFPREEFYV